MTKKLIPPIKSLLLLNSICYALNVFKFIGLVLILVSFSYYVLEHGTCSSFDADMTKCETIKNQSQQNSDSSHNNENNNSAETSLHACGCASLFISSLNTNIFNHIQTITFGFQNLGFRINDFKERIERPPISRS